MLTFPLLGSNWMGGESSPGDKRILEPTIPGSQGQASSDPREHMCSYKLSITSYLKLMRREVN